MCTTTFWRLPRRHGRTRYYCHPGGLLVAPYHHMTIITRRNPWWHYMQPKRCNRRHCYNHLCLSESVCFPLSLSSDCLSRTTLRQARLNYVQKNKWRTTETKKKCNKDSKKDRDKEEHQALKKGSRSVREQISPQARDARYVVYPTSETNRQEAQTLIRLSWRALRFRHPSFIRRSSRGYQQPTVDS